MKNAVPFVRFQRRDPEAAPVDPVRAHFPHRIKSDLNVVVASRFAMLDGLAILVRGSIEFADGAEV